MALTRKGKLFAGALFAGVLFGPQPQEVAAEQPEYHGGGLRRDVSYDEVSKQWELLGLRTQPTIPAPAAAPVTTEAPAPLATEPIQSLAIPPAAQALHVTLAPPVDIQSIEILGPQGEPDATLATAQDDDALALLLILIGAHS